jgi:3D (Asp-Asp-Asp) domain-containing protein
MKVSHYKPLAVVQFYTETGDLVARASNVESSKYDDDVVSIQTVRDMGADAPTFVINMVNRKPWHEWVTPNDLVIITMQRPPEALAEVMFGLVDDCRRKVRAADKPERVITITGRGLAKAFIQFDVGHVPEVEYQETSVGWLQSNNVILAGKTADQVLSAFWTNIAQKHVNYKWSNGKTLFEIMSPKFRSRQDLILLESSTLVNYQGSMWSFVKEIAETPFNEAYWEIYDHKPYLLTRATPFSEADWSQLPSLTLTDDEVASESLGRSDLETYTLFSVGAKTMYSDADVFKTFGVPPMWYEPFADKYGIRRLHVETSYSAVGGAQDLESKDSLMSLRESLYNWNVLNNTMFNGTFIVRGSNRFKVGYRLMYNNMEFYITKVSHSFVNFGSWVTELGVTRGMAPNKRFKSPYGAGTDYTGIGLVPYNPQAAQQALQSSGDTLMPIDGENLDKAQKVIAGANAMMATGQVRYRFGANDPMGGKLDCSSFTYWIYKQYAGIDIGRTTGQQVLKGTKVEKDQLSPGDLVFFRNTYNSSHIYGVSHVGIYIGGGKFINNSSSKNIHVAELSNSYWSQHWLMGRRVLTVNKTAVGDVGVPGKTMTMVATAYGASVLNGGAGTGVTASGTKPVEGRTIAVDRTVIPLGTKVRIDSDFPGVSGIYVAEDVGGAIKQNRIDIYFDDMAVDPHVARKRMYAFGKRQIKVTIMN